MTTPPPTQQIHTENPRVMIVDGSKLARRMIEKEILEDLPGAQIQSFDKGEEAKRAIAAGPVDLVTTALSLPDMDGDQLAAYIRECGHQAYIPIIVVSGDVNARLERREISPHVTDYFDKALGPKALSAFIRGYIKSEKHPGGSVLYVEDSRVVAMKTRKLMESHGLTVSHVVSVEDALALLETAKAQGQIGADLVLTDVYLKGGLTGKELLEEVRGKLGWNKGDLPILVMTGDDNPANQSALIKAGANDLVMKPTEERLLMTKILFQLKVGQNVRATRQGKAAG
jgi:CheY-like chemotaxis protein